MQFSLLKNIILRKPLKEFVTLNDKTILASDFSSYTIFNSVKYELTDKEAIVCLKPLQICILMDVVLPSRIQIFYAFKNIVTASVILEKREDYVFNNSSLQLYYSKKAQLKAHSFLERYLYFKKINANKMTYSYLEYTLLSGAFFFPRKVIMVSVRCDDFYSVFPMDLQICSHSNNMVYLGLRKSNQTNRFLGNPSLKISIANFSEKFKEDAYFFGKFHFNKFPDLKNLQYTFLQSKFNNNIFPDFIENYKELALIDWHDLGEQNLLVCKIVNTSESQAGFISLYHLHYLAING